MPATNDPASLENERNSLVIEGEGMAVTCTQIAGILARRIVCWPRSGDNLARGQRFGLIKFGSRTDLLMPSHVELHVAVGDRVKGGATIIARVPISERTGTLFGVRTTPPAETAATPCSGTKDVPVLRGSPATA